MTEIHKYFQLKVRLQTTIREEHSASTIISNLLSIRLVCMDIKLNSARLVCLTQRDAENAASSVILWRSFRMEHNKLFTVSKSKNKQYDKIVPS